jgi:hypothetical protein
MSKVPEAKYAICRMMSEVDLRNSREGEGKALPRYLFAGTNFWSIEWEKLIIYL